jgi:hypothetical protein
VAKAAEPVPTPGTNELNPFVWTEESIPVGLRSPRTQKPPRSGLWSVSSLSRWARRLYSTTSKVPQSRLPPREYYVGCIVAYCAFVPAEESSPSSSRAIGIPEPQSHIWEHAPGSRPLSLALCSKIGGEDEAPIRAMRQRRNTSLMVDGTVFHRRSVWILALCLCRADHSKATTCPSASRRQSMRRWRWVWGGRHAGTIYLHCQQRQKKGTTRHLPARKETSRINRSKPKQSKDLRLRIEQLPPLPPGIAVQQRFEKRARLTRSIAA